MFLSKNVDLSKGMFLFVTLFEIIIIIKNIVIKNTKVQRHNKQAAVAHIKTYGEIP